MVYLQGKQVGPYMDVSKDEVFYEYRIILYGAYNALGAIMPERNGIAVLHEEEKEVLLDRHMEQDCGYYGPSQAQLAEFKRLVNLPYVELVDFVEGHKSRR